MERIQGFFKGLKELWQEHPVMLSLAGIGVLVVGAKTIKYAKKAGKLLTRPTANFWEQYGGKDTWAVIAGMRNPLTFAYAKALADLGFHLLIMGQRQDPLLKSTESLEHSKVKIEYLPFDFGAGWKEEQYGAVQKAVTEKEVGIYVNFEEDIPGLSFSDMPPSKMMDGVNASIGQVTYMTRLLIPLMQKRKQRSGIISVVSPAYNPSSPFSSTLLASKAYSKALMDSMSSELKGTNVDTLTCIVTELKVEEPVDSVNASDALSAISYLGKKEKVYGTIRIYVPPKEIIKLDVSKMPTEAHEAIDDRKEESKLREKQKGGLKEEKKGKLKAEKRAARYLSNKVGPQASCKAPYFAGTVWDPEEGIKKINLNEYKGRYVVLFFYSRNFSLVCPTEIMEFSRLYDSFKETKCEVIGCSSDSQYAHMQFAATEVDEGGVKKVKLPLLADTSHKIAQAYGAYIDKGEEAGSNVRATFIIDAEGIIRHVSINDLQVGRNAEEILRLVQGFQFTDSHYAVCPSRWKKGGRTLEPDPKSEVTKKYWEEELGKKEA